MPSPGEYAVALALSSNVFADPPNLLLPPIDINHFLDHSSNRTYPGAHKRAIILFRS